MCINEGRWISCWADADDVEFSLGFPDKTGQMLFKDEMALLHPVQLLTSPLKNVCLVWRFSCLLSSHKAVFAFLGKFHNPPFCSYRRLSDGLRVEVFKNRIFFTQEMFWILPGWCENTSEVMCKLFLISNKSFGKFLHGTVSDF